MLRNTIGKYGLGPFTLADLSNIYTDDKIPREQRRIIPIVKSSFISEESTSVMPPFINSFSGMLNALKKSNSRESSIERSPRNKSDTISNIKTSSSYIQNKLSPVSTPTNRSQDMTPTTNIKTSASYIEIQSKNSPVSTPSSKPKVHTSTNSISSALRLAKTAQTKRKTGNYKK